MLTNTFMLLVALFGAILFLLLPGALWVGAVLMVLLAWLVYMVLFIPYKSAETRGTWALVGCFVLVSVILSSLVLVYLQVNSIPVNLIGGALSITPYLDARLFSLIVGTLMSLPVTLIFFAAIGYFSSVYVLGAPYEEDMTFWQAFVSFACLILNVQLAWLLIEDGKIIEIRKLGYKFSWLNLGKIIIKPGNAVVFQDGGKVTRIVGSGIVITSSRFEEIRTVFDLRPHFDVTKLENVITADQIPLTMEVGVGYRIQPAANPAGPGVIKEKNLDLFPVEEETLRKAAFNVTAGGWNGFGFNAPQNALRDQIMTHRLDELFELGGNAANPTQLRVNDRQIKLIEQEVVDTMNGFAGNLGVLITGLDIRQIDLPDEVVEALGMEIKSQAEADAIQRIEAQRNAASAGLVNEILDGISSGMGSRSMSDIEVQLANHFATISQRALTDDVLGHQYIAMLEKLADSEATKIFNTTPPESRIQADHLPLPIAPTNGKGNGNS